MKQFIWINILFRTVGPSGLVNALLVLIAILLQIQYYTPFLIRQKIQFQSVFSPRNPMTHSSSPTPLGIDEAMPEINISTNGILNLLGNLEPTKAAGPGRIKPLVLKKLREQKAPILKVIFQLSLEQWQVPKELTNTNVTPLTRREKCQSRQTSAQSLLHVFYVRCLST